MRYIRDFTQSALVNFDELFNSPRRLHFITPFRGAAKGWGGGGHDDSERRA